MKNNDDPSLEDIAAIVNEVKVSEAEKAKVEPVNQKTQWLNAGNVRLCLIIIGLLLIAMQVPELLKMSEKKLVLRDGSSDVSPAVEKTIIELWKFSSLISRGDKLPTGQICPASGLPYTISQDGTDLSVRCPGVQKAGFSEIMISRSHPVPLLRPI